MKGIVLAAGKGTRMAGIDFNKCLGIVDKKSLIFHNIERLLLMGISDIVIVVGKDSDSIKKHVEEYQINAKISFAEQRLQSGIVNAVKCASSLIGDDDFVLCLGDEIFVNQKPIEMLDFFTCTGADCVCGIVPNESEDEIRKCYSVLVDDTENILDLTEKPEKPYNSLKGTGFCIFRNRTLDFIGDVIQNPKSGQYELCDWIKLCIRKGMICKAFNIADKEFNINTLEDLQAANDFLDPGERRGNE